MKHRELASFIGDLRRLSKAERETFLRVLHGEFHPACERFRADRATPWPRSLRVKRVEGLPGAWEMAWSFAGPDARATFKWVDIDGEPGIQWRRIGGHEFFDRA